jgi:voltage-gated potassium channel
MTATASSIARLRRRRTLTSLARSLLTVALMTVAYYRAPLDRSFGGGVTLLFLLGLLALAVSIAWQARAIAVSETPRLRAIESVMVALPFLILLYASAYVLLSQSNPENFTEALDKTDALYFTMTVLSTVGFGDITPTTDAARILTMTQMAVGLVAVGIVAKLLIGAVQKAVDRQGPNPRPPGQADSVSAGRDDGSDAGATTPRTKAPAAPRRRSRRGRRAAR